MHEDANVAAFKAGVAGAKVPGAAAGKKDKKTKKDKKDPRKRAPPFLVPQ